MMYEIHRGIMKQFHNLKNVKRSDNSVKLEKLVMLLKIYKRYNLSMD
jgi:hypothetical protein